MAGLQRFHLELQMCEQQSQALEVPGGLLGAHAGGGGGLSSALHSSGWGQPHRRSSTTDFSSLETSQLCLGLQTWFADTP